jgi:serine beta-lactamase-like protein LACTB, mitochondrial
MSIAVVRDNQVVWTEAFGLADVENEVAVVADAVFRIASISKPITATAIMQLVEGGRVALDDPVQKYVQAFPTKGEQAITLRHLLSHTSGIRHYKGDEFNQKEPFDSIETALEVFKDDPLLFTPGTKYSYSTYGYNLLAGVVENASGLNFESYVREHIWNPAGMSATALEHPQQIVKHRVRQYVRSGARAVINAPYADLSVKWAGGGMISTVADLGRFHIALEAGTLLKRETLEQMYTPFTLANGTPTTYGLGWSVSNERGRRWISHSGGATGGTTYLLRSPEQKLAVAILTNVEDGVGLRHLAHAIARAAADLPPPGVH